MHRKILEGEREGWREGGKMGEREREREKRGKGWRDGRGGTEFDVEVEFN